MEYSADDRHTHLNASQAFVGAVQKESQRDNAPITEETSNQLTSPMLVPTGAFAAEPDVSHQQFHDPFPSLIDVDEANVEGEITEEQQEEEVVYGYVYVEGFFNGQGQFMLVFHLSPYMKVFY